MNQTTKKDKSALMEIKEKFLEYVKCRNPEVEQWVAKLIHEIEKRDEYLETGNNHGKEEIFLKEVGTNSMPKKPLSAIQKCLSELPNVMTTLEFWNLTR